MGKYLLHATYTQAGLVGLLKEGGTSRRAALASTIEGAGGSLESLYYAFGGRDLYITADLPDDATATAVSLNIEHRRRRCPQRGRNRTPHAGDRGRSNQEGRVLPRPRSLIGRSHSGC